MLFLRQIQKKHNKSTAHSLRACPDRPQDILKVIVLCPRLRITDKPSKRASFFPFSSGPRQSRLRVHGHTWIQTFLHCKTAASMTLEAAFVLPFFLFAMLNIIYAMNIIGTQSRLNAALHQTGNKMAFAGYAAGQLAEESTGIGLTGVVLSELYAKGEILEYAGREYLDQSCVRDGSAGISMLGSEVMGAEDVIDLRVHYTVKPFAGLMAFDAFQVSQRYYGRAWTGYDPRHYAGEENEEDPMVYITETGTVYHIDRNCTYLNPAVHSVSAADVGNRRNASGGKYHACEICGSRVELTTVYITDQGSSYHNNLNCSGLKRTIYTVPLSQTGGRGRCSKCG